MIGAFFHMFTGAMFIFFSVRFLNICKSRTGCPTSIEIYESVIASLSSWLGWWMQADSLPSDQQFSCKWNLSFFKAVPSNRLSFYLGSLLHIISSLFIHFFLFQNAILHKMLKLGFWNFKPVFLRIQFSLVATFFPLVLVTSLSWYFHHTIIYLTLVT